MIFKRCLSCGKKFRRYPQIQNQSFCSEAPCQRHRKREWQKARKKKDPAYKDNQSRAQQAWSGRNSGYWNEYRRTHPKYQERNRKGQRKRNGKRKECLIAKMDASAQGNHLPPGIYRLIPVNVPGIAKMDSWTVEIKVLSKG